MILQQGLFFVGGCRAGIFGLRVEQGGLVNPTRHWGEKNSLGLDLSLRYCSQTCLKVVWNAYCRHSPYGQR